MARAYRSVDLQLDRSASAFRWRNDVVDVLQKLLKMMCEPHEPGRPQAAAAQIKFPYCWQAVHGVDPPTNA